MKLEKKDGRFRIRISERKKKLLEYVSVKNNLSMSRYIELMIDKLILNTEIQIKNGELTYEDIEKEIEKIRETKERLRSLVPNYRKNK